jgi:cystathionine beta-lyase family protein involved in aluminum resistance
VAAAGEGRSANRAKWATAELAGSSSAAAATAVLDSAAEQQQGAEPRVEASDLVWAAAADARPLFDGIDRMVHANLKRVQQAMRRHRIGPHHFAGSTGYGHGDLGRAALDEVVAEVMGAEAAAVRIQFVSGTHAISAALFGCLR